MSTIMKADPSKKDNDDTEINYSCQKGQEFDIENNTKDLNYCKGSFVGLESGSQNGSESDCLIICNPDLAASFQTLKTDRSKLKPGHYLQKVFFNSVAQKFRSQSLPNCLDKKKHKHITSCVSPLDETNETSLPLVSLNSSSNDESKNGSRPIDSKEPVTYTQDWFKTWPERTTEKFVLNENVTSENQLLDEENACRDSVGSSLLGHHEAVPSQGSSHEQNNPISGNQLNSKPNVPFISQRPTSSGSSSKHIKSGDTISKPIPLDELLDNFNLAYSPVTKQLHLVYPCTTNKDKECSNLITGCDFNEENLTLDENGGFLGTNECFEHATRDSEHDVRYYSSGHVPRHTNDVLSSFSSTVSSLSDISPSNNEDSALGSLLDNNDACSLLSVGGCSALSEDSLTTGEKSRKKSLTGIFSRNLFNWKSTSKSDDSISGWKLFGKNSSPASSHSSLTVDYSECQAPDSPACSRSSREPHIASSGSGSGALIQLARPACLPAKSQEEDDRHRKEYQKILNASRDRELKEAKQRKKQLQVQLKAEEQLAQAIQIWTNEILPCWQQMHTSKKAQELWWKGVPPCVRGRVWNRAIGNSLKLTHSLYDYCVHRAQDRLKNGDCGGVGKGDCGGSGDRTEADSDNKEASMQLIQFDISRTFPHLCIFQKGGPYYDMLHCLLAAYVCYRPDVGYVQGMSFVAAVLILNMDAPDAFVCFANLLDRPCHAAFFHLDQPMMQAYYTTYNDLFKENLPQLYQHFSRTTLTPDLYLLDWIYSVFTKAMNLDLACRIWDVFLRDGEEFLFRTALGVLHLCQDSLVQMDFVRGSQFLTRLPDDLSADQLFKSISLIKMSIGKRTFEDILAVNSMDCH